MTPLRDSLGLDDFTEALEMLDGILDERIEIRAIGGFALIWHGLRSGGVTGDIDTVTPTYPRKARRAIDTVARELALPPDWINNDAVLSFDGETTWDDVDAFDALLDARYDKAEVGLDKVSLFVADLPTLAKAKAFAVEDIGIGRTQKDADDLRSVLRAMRVRSADYAREALPWLGDPEFAKTLRLIETTDWSEGITL